MVKLRCVNHRLVQLGTTMISSGDIIAISTEQLQQSLSKLEHPIKDYVWIQSRFNETSDPQKDFDFRRRFNRYYRVRRNARWQDSFYELMGSCKNKAIDLKYVLSELHKGTNRIEASFASKLVATLNPRCPVIDSIVLKNLGLKLPKYTAQNRIDLTCAVYQALTDRFANYLASSDGKKLVGGFRRKYPDVDITETKMLDLILWQMR
jgi:hypothetical protein